MEQNSQSLADFFHLLSKLLTYHCQNKVTLLRRPRGVRIYALHRYVTVQRRGLQVEADNGTQTQRIRKSPLTTTAEHYVCRTTQLGTIEM